MALFNFKSICVLLFHGYSILLICNCLVKRSYDHYNADKSIYYAGHARLNISIASCEMELKCFRHKNSEKLTIPIKSHSKPSHHPR